MALRSAHSSLQSIYTRDTGAKYTEYWATRDAIYIINLEHVSKCLRLHSASTPPLEVERRYGMFVVWPKINSRWVDSIISLDAAAASATIIK